MSDSMVVSPKLIRFNMDKKLHIEEDENLVGVIFPLYEQMWEVAEIRLIGYTMYAIIKKTEYAQETDRDLLEEFIERTNIKSTCPFCKKRMSHKTGLHNHKENCVVARADKWIQKNS